MTPIVQEPVVRQMPAAGAESANGEYVFEAIGVSKSFGGVVALDRVDLRLKPQQRRGLHEVGRDFTFSSPDLQPRRQPPMRPRTVA